MRAFPDALRSHFDSPRHVGEPAGGAQARGEARNAACGDHAVLFLALSAGRVAAAGFKARGCPVAMAAGSALCEILPGRAADEDLPAAVAERLAGEFGLHAPGHRHALALWTDALRSAIAP